MLGWYSERVECMNGYIYVCVCSSGLWTHVMCAKTQQRKKKKRGAQKQESGQEKKKKKKKGEVEGINGRDVCEIRTRPEEVVVLC